MGEAPGPTEGNYDMYDVLERDVAEQRVLTEQRHTTVDGLSDWISAALGRLYAAAAELGLGAGASFVIYHGEVNEDSDGPVECCVSINGEADLGDLPHRIEPAHREAYTRITVAQVEFPQILSAYEAVESGCRATVEKQVARLGSLLRRLRQAGTGRRGLRHRLPHLLSGFTADPRTCRQRQQWSG